MTVINRPRAALMPTATPGSAKRNGLSITRAPAASAICRVASIDPPSATTISYPMELVRCRRIESRQPGRSRSALRTGTTTERVTEFSPLVVTSGYGATCSVPTGIAPSLSLLYARTSELLFRRIRASSCPTAWADLSNDRVPLQRWPSATR